MGCVSRIIHDGGGGHAAAPLPRRSHAGTMQRRAATVPPPCRRRAAAVPPPCRRRAAAAPLYAVNAKKVNHLNLMCINFMRKLPSGKVYLLGQYALIACSCCLRY